MASKRAALLALYLVLAVLAGCSTAQPGDVMLYQDNQVTMFTGSNTWAYTRLGHIEGVDASELAAILDDGDVTATLSLG